ncbi:Pentatricopeptide repeat-containing protein [Hibiscus syriacus]|uniref:Pentatricopeptide repeat-containing protein n=1 Tax=Hibiscus syriacus TaxID=106335 RepID=A0A6A3C4V6_HIBSY|nr:pentatricopeptide repeat-containing protein At4g21705, mitochondrial-like [Hibiscus syriacus]KAE8723031.1 Pentatricopeptide repeat-containing protein [Hibiscus syriacus]
MNSTRLLLNSKSQAPCGFFSRFYYTNRVNKATLYSRISPLGGPDKSVEAELEDWLKHGNNIRVAELQRIIQDLRKRKRFTQALQVSEWMNKKGLCAFSPTEHAVQLDLIGKVRGFATAESYFNGLKDQDKTDKTYGALLNCYVRQRQTDKSLSHLRKMKELGFASTALTYNDIMCLYTNTGQHEKVPDVMREMKEKNVSPDNFSYRICINSVGLMSNLEGMEIFLTEMENQPHIKMDWNTYAVVANFYIKAGLTEKAIDQLKKSEQKLDNKDGTGYNHLISLYASLGDKTEVLRLWGLEKAACKRYLNKDFITMLQSLVRLDELEEAEKVLKEWESSGNCYDLRIPNIVIAGYIRRGLHEKAEAMLENLMEKGKTTTPNSWGILAASYLDKGQVKKAFECMKAALSLLGEDKGWKPNFRVVTGILDWVGDEGSVRDTEEFVELLRRTIPVDRKMYHALLKANIRHGKRVDKLLVRMKADKINEDEETKTILAMKSS